MGSTGDRIPQVPTPRASFRPLRLNRSVMVAAIAGSSAYAAGAGMARSLWMTLAGWCLVVGGFSLDFYADRDERRVPNHPIFQPSNPPHLQEAS